MQGERTFCGGPLKLLYRKSLLSCTQLYCYPPPKPGCTNCVQTLVFRPRQPTDSVDMCGHFGGYARKEKEKEKETEKKKNKKKKNKMKGERRRRRGIITTREKMICHTIGMTIASFLRCTHMQLQSTHAVAAQNSREPVKLCPTVCQCQGCGPMADGSFLRKRVCQTSRLFHTWRATKPLRTGYETCKR